MSARRRAHLRTRLHPAFGVRGVTLPAGRSFAGVTRAAGAAALLSVVLTGCGDGPRHEAGDRPRSGASVIAATGFAPTPELTKLIEAEVANARKRDVDVAVTQREARDAPGQIGQLRSDLDDASGLAAVIVGAMDPAAAEGVIKDNTGPDHPAVVSLVEPLEGAKYSIDLDVQAVALTLAGEAREWAAGHKAKAATVIAPPDGTFDDWTVPVGRRTAAAITDALKQAGFAVTTVPALGAADAGPAVRATKARVVIGWNDVTALAAAEALRTRKADKFIAAAGSPTPTSADALDALRDDRLQLIVGTRLADLASMIVTAAAVQPNDAATAVSYPLQLRTFTAKSRATRLAWKDYGRERPRGRR